MNLPFHKIHDITNGYGTLLFPLFKRWIMIKNFKIMLTDKKYNFHNCTIAGIK